LGQGLRDGPELTIELTVEKLVPGGAGYCRLPDGRSAFVDGALPGDRITVHGLEEKRGYVRATGFDLASPSPERVTPPCPIADECGGCDWMHLELGAQRRHKATLVAEALERTGRVRLPLLPEVVTRGEALGYRSRLRVHVDARGAVGFFGRRTRSLVEVPACAVAHPAVNRVLGLLARLEPAHAELLGRFEAVELAVAREGEGAEARLWPRAPLDEPAVAPLLAHLRAEGVLVGVAPPPRSKQRPRAAEERPWAAFTQVNPAVNAALVEAVTAVAAALGSKTFLDLYGGAGNFSLPLASAGLRGVLVELDRTAADLARRAAHERGLTLEVLALDVSRGLAELVRRRASFELLVLDPPRAGAKEALAGIVALRPPAVAYVSCDPVTLARDLKELVAAGYELESVRCFDMFPQTHHVETLVWLARSGA
jgi:23S rRNA (uracil1939-C5)-methyltransferase